MHKIERHTHDFLAANGAEKYMLACSGGVDSMVLFHVLVKLDLPIELMHVNYNLRGEASAMDEQFVAQKCREKGVRCHVHRLDMVEYLKNNGGNLQEEARKIRYSFFESLKAENVCILLAHHADDQVETFFLNLTRNSGMMGLSGMLPANNGYLRPLLSFTRKDILAYAKEENIVWREDESNQLLKYNRNKWRHIFLPYLEGQLPNLRESTLTILALFQKSQELLEEKIVSLIEKIKSSGTLSFADFDQLDEHDRAELIVHLGLSKRSESRLRQLRAAQKGAFLEVNLHHYHRMIRERDAFVFQENHGSKINFTLQIEEVHDLPNFFNKHELYVNPHKIKGKLELRTWRLGDRMAPVGMKGTKLISDILTDAGIPSHQRSGKLVVCDKEKILWCVGHCISRDAIALSAGEKLKITVLPKKYNQ